MTPAGNWIPDELDDSELHMAVELAARVSRDSPARRLATACLRGQPLAGAQALFDVLHDPRANLWRERVLAAWTLGRSPLTDEEKDVAVGALLDTLEESQREPIWWRIVRGTFRSIGVGTAAATLLCALLLLRGEYVFPIWESFFQMVTVFSAIGYAVVLPLSFVYDGTLESHVRGQAALALGRLGAREAAGALAAAAMERDAEVRSAAASALHAVLPAIGPEHLGEFGAQTSVSLGRALKHSDGKLVSRLLDALAYAGTSHAIPYVDRLRERGRTLRIRDQAADVLEVLKERQAREVRSDRLLRPAAPVAGLDALLRPARDASDLDPSLLLRASDESAN